MDIETRSLKQYNIEMKIEEDFREKNDFVVGIGVFDDMLNHKQKQIEPGFTTERQKDSDYKFWFRSFFDIPKKFKPSQQQRFFLLKRSSKEVRKPLQRFCWIWYEL